MTSSQKHPPSDQPSPARKPGQGTLTSAVLDETEALEYAVDAQGCIVRFNAACERLSGYSFSELQNIPFWEKLIQPEVRSSTQMLFLNMVANQLVAPQATLTWVSRSGQHHLIVWENHVVQDSSGAIQEIVSTGQDITAEPPLNARINLLQRQAQNERMLEEQVFSSVPVGMAIYQVEGPCVLVNDAACLIAHSSREQLLSQNFRLLPTWKQSGLLQAAEGVLASGKPEALEIHLVATLGVEVWLLCRLNRFSLNGKPHLLLISEDISEQRQAQAQLRRQSEQQALLLELSQLLAEAALEPERLMELAVKQIGSRLGDMCLLSQVAADGQTIEPVAFYHANPGIRAVLWSMLSGQPTRMGEGFLGEALQSGKPSLLSSLLEPDQINRVLERYRPLLERAHMISILAVPLRVQGQVIGGLIVGRESPDQPFTSEDQHLVQLLADRSALAITNARLYTENLRHKTELEQRVAERTAALQQSEQTLRILLDAIPEFAFLMALDGRIINGNQSLARVMNLPMEQLPGKNIYDLLANQANPLREASVRRVVESQAPVIFEDRFDEVILSSRLYPVFGPSGAVESLAVLAINVSEQERLIQDLRDREERFRAIFDQAGVGMTLASIDGRYLRVNRRFCEITGYSEAELANLPYASITHPDDRSANQALLQRAMRHEIKNFTLEKRFVHKNGSTIWANVTISLVSSPVGTPAYSVGIVEDISERKQAQFMLEERTRELARSNADLEQFAYIASHDLQEPLRMITGFSQLIARRYKGKLDADADEFIRYITDGVQHMQHLIDDLLSYSRLSRRSRPFMAVDLAHVFKLAKSNLQTSIEETQALITNDALPVVHGDETLLVQLLQNLIENSMKFHSDVPPHVHISARHKDAEWQISVRDNGIGIEPQYFERIFILFQRLHLREEYPGTGIGLAVCKKIVERHGGRIWVESEPGQGSTFYFSIPDRKTDGAASAAPA